MFAGLVPGGRDVDVDCDAEEGPVVLAEPQVVVAPLPLVEIDRAAHLLQALCSHKGKGATV